ncbi:MAG: porin family protein [Gammaproteobacteria bacterium]|nr:porin family protein [Gammaproteobacteria bacterium]
MLYNRVLLGALVLVMVQPVFAGNNRLSDYHPGFYVGAQAGYARTSEGGGPEDYINQFSGPKEIKKGKFGGKLLVGYSFLPYLGLEAGYTYYPDNHYKSSEPMHDIVARFRTLDLMVKGILALEHFSPELVGWGMFGKLGAAVTGLDNNTADDSDHKHLKAILVRPAYALGVGYNFTDNFAIDLSFSGVYGGNKFTAQDVSNHLNGSRINKCYSANILAIGVSYKF